MDIQENIQGHFFEWDEEKNELNIQKHHISFKTASYVFKDICRLEIYDEYHSDLEDRYITIGRVNDILCVIYTERGQNIRIISARLATPRERRLYYGNSKNLY